MDFRDFTPVKSQRVQRRMMGSTRFHAMKGDALAMHMQQAMEHREKTLEPVWNDLDTLDRKQGLSTLKD